MIQIDADLQINTHQFNVHCFNQDDKLIVAMNGSDVPKFPMPSIRQMFRSKHFLNRIDQEIIFTYEKKPVLAIRDHAFRILSIKRFIQLFVKSRF